MLKSPKICLLPRPQKGQQRYTNYPPNRAGFETKTFRIGNTLFLPPPPLTYQYQSAPEKGEVSYYTRQSRTITLWENAAEELGRRTRGGRRSRGGRGATRERQLSRDKRVRKSSFACWPRPPTFSHLAFFSSHTHYYTAAGGGLSSKSARGPRKTSHPVALDSHTGPGGGGRGGIPVDRRTLPAPFPQLQDVPPRPRGVITYCRSTMGRRYPPLTWKETRVKAGLFFFPRSRPERASALLPSTHSAHRGPTNRRTHSQTTPSLRLPFADFRSR